MTIRPPNVTTFVEVQNWRLTSLRTQMVALIADTCGSFVKEQRVGRPVANDCRSVSWLRCRITAAVDEAGRDVQQWWTPYLLSATASTTSNNWLANECHRKRDLLLLIILHIIYNIEFISYAVCVHSHCCTRI